MVVSHSLPPQKQQQHPEIERHMNIEVFKEQATLFNEFRLDM